MGILNGNFYPVAFGIEDNAFVIPVAGSSGLPDYGDAVIGHLLGKLVYLFF